jgi:hypothetical protein
MNDRELSVTGLAAIATLIFFVLAAAILLLAPKAHAANLIVNPSFETIDPYDATGYGYWALDWRRGYWVEGWRLTDAITAPGDSMPDGRLAAYCDPDNAQELPTWMWTDQTLGAGAYKLSFWAKWVYHYYPSFAIRLRVGGWENDFALPSDGAWHHYSTVGAWTTPGQLYIGAIGYGDDACMADMVSVEPVPECRGVLVLALGLMACAGGYYGRGRLP